MASKPDCAGQKTRWEHYRVGRCSQALRRVFRPVGVEEDEDYPTTPRSSAPRCLSISGHPTAGPAKDMGDFGAGNPAGPGQLEYIISTYYARWCVGRQACCR